MSVPSVPAFDPRSLRSLQNLGQQGDSPEALRAAAKQFEAVMLQQMLKAMRATVPRNDFSSSDAERMFQEMSDQQLAQNLAASHGIGLGELLARQLQQRLGKGAETAAAGTVPAAAGTASAGGASASAAAAPGISLAGVLRRPANLAGNRQMAAEAGAPVEEKGFFAALGGASDTAAPLVPLEDGTARPLFAPAEAGAGLIPALSAAASEVRRAQGDGAEVPEKIRRFVQDTLPQAKRAAAQLGVPAEFLVAQAALESGWGEAVITRPDGRSSHNLFNIKAGSSWSGPTVTLPVTEYDNGRAVTENARFRVYPSYAAAFDDYVRLIRDNERYADVPGSRTPREFASALVRGGYATDPRYADKIVSILQDRRFRAALPG
ncbi:MAG: flagellar assembly peptidoglycan hydrolase FlgJ [Rhodocyclales bacterium]|nr:flagellar assembly peptidoglycan hydrolase FlgJ [Rhodocyclales bacterium]